MQKREKSFGKMHYVAFPCVPFPFPVNLFQFTSLGDTRDVAMWCMSTAYSSPPFRQFNYNHLDMWWEIMYFVYAKYCCYIFLCRFMSCFPTLHAVPVRLLLRVKWLAETYSHWSEIKSIFAPKTEHINPKSGFLPVLFRSTPSRIENRVRDRKSLIGLCQAVALCYHGNCN